MTKLVIILGGVTLGFVLSLLAIQKIISIIDRKKYKGKVDLSMRAYKVFTRGDPHNN